MVRRWVGLIVGSETNAIGEGKNTSSAFRDIEALSAEEPGIEGTGPGRTIAKAAPMAAKMNGIHSWRDWWLF